MNSVNLIGRLTKDPELRTTSSGTTVLEASIAINEVRKGENVGMFFDFIAFGKTAELISTYVKKGEMLGISGKLTQSNYTDREGKNRSSIKITVNELTMLPQNRPPKKEVKQWVDEDMKQEAKNKLGDIDKFAEVQLDEGDLPF